MEVTTHRKRRPNFSNQEVLTMLREVKLRKSIIMGKLDHNNSSAMKNDAWESVLKAVNQVARIPRDVGEIRKKFVDLRASVKKKSNHDKYMRLAGSGTHIPANYSPAEEAMLQLEEPTSIIGLPLAGLYDSEEGLDDVKDSYGEKFLPSATGEESLTVVMPGPSHHSSDDYEVRVPIISTDHSISADHPYTARDTQESLLDRRSLNGSRSQSWFRVPVPASGDQEESPNQQQSSSCERSQSSRSPQTPSESEDTRHASEMLEVQQTSIKDVLVDLVSSVKDGLSGIQSIVSAQQNVAYQNGDMSDESRSSIKHEYQTKRKWDNSLDTAVKAIKVIAEQEKRKQECEFECFARHIAAQLKKLPLEKAVALQIEIQNMIGRERLKMLKEENSVSVENTDQSNHE